MAENVVNTYNLFIDTSRGRSADSQGDNFHLHLGHAGIVCEAGQYIRMTLNNFNMHKTFTDINDTNNRFTVRVNSNAGSNNAQLTKRNNTTLNALADDFATQMGAALKSAAGLGAGVTVTASNVKPSSTTSLGGDSDYIISFLLTFGSAHGINDAICQLFLDSGDSYEVLGGDRIEDLTDTTSSSIDMSVESNTTIQVTCRYPAQRQTIEHVYMRCLGIPNTSIETLGLADPTESHKSDTTDSDILARVPVATEYCTYEAQSGREFFMNIRQKVVPNLHFRLTDRHNRPLGRGSSNASSKTASGSGSNQSTLGNLSFSAVIRFDIIQQRHIKELETKPVAETTARRFENVLAQPKFGRDAYGTGVGR
jgi:hypothetical protein